MKLSWAAFFVFGCSIAGAELDALRTEARTALLKGAQFFSEEVASHGTYLWQYSEDLSKREGEGKATLDQGWVQPPGTPAVSMAYLEAWEATKEGYFLEAAKQTARGLLRGQLHSGGWAHSIEFNPEARKKHAYRDREKKGRNYTTFDDDSTQAALRFLGRLDAALEFRDAQIREAMDYALSCILQAQYPNGAWPQGYDKFPDPEQHPVKRASYPEGWAREYPGHQNYWYRYTLNDRALITLITTMLELASIYEKAPAGVKDWSGRCRGAAIKGGDFLLLARMPEPQPIWAQQYDFQMHPAWARKFEPPSVTAGESQDVLRALIRLYEETGEQKYLAPIPRALKYLRSVRLPDGRLARFYELKSSKPLYFTREYRLTYEDGDLPTHYAFKVEDRTAAIEREYLRVKSGGGNAAKSERRERSGRLETEVRAIIAAQDERGRWVEEGRLRHHGQNDPTRRIIRSSTFVSHVLTLSRYLACGGAVEE